MNNKKILLLTLVHPDFLPPVYAVAQVLRDLGLDIHILTFDSFVSVDIKLGNNIILESVGNHHDANTIERMKLRKRFTDKTIFGVTEFTVGDEVNYFVKLEDAKSWTTVKIDNARNIEVTEKYKKM